ncbi:TetR/AcrR family transcriptional regulator [Amycolatopsis cihanbeyliensis]|uniref:TetR/AcrR family transcriptional regulator n=1 Tax=Amycolatopsis cihanbeyliensis TaxID=1128664 RepID=UPI001476E825|nr:TetR family transcriptional regulator [Amycolatopsis cihanbeyliensis]
MTTTNQREYGGMSADARKARRRAELLRAGLDLLGTAGMPGLTVRGVVDRAQLAPRYFYESFSNIDELAIAVFDQVVREMIDTGLAAIAEAGTTLRARVHAGLGAVAGLLTGDPRKGRVLLIESMASPVLAPRRQEAAGTIARLVAEQADGDPAYRPAEAGTTAITARFLVGGFSEALGALIQGPGEQGREAVVDRCTELFLACAGAWQGPPGTRDDRADTAG